MQGVPGDRFGAFCPRPPFPPPFPPNCPVCPTGPQGSVGPMGPQGVQGPTGPQGPQGPQGAQGPQGVPGPTGPTGPQGAVGATGPQGIQGAQGFQGAQGPAGATGAPGPAGPAGAAELSAYALGGAQGTLNAAANTPIAFPSFVAQPAASVTQNAGTFTLVTPGTYLVTAVLNPPPSSALATDVVLRANGTPISSTQTRIANGDNAASYTLQTLVTSTGATTVSLTASGALALTGTTPEDTLASITFLRIG